MKKIIIRINPFKKDEGDISKGLYVIKKLLGFFLVYISSMIIGEVIVVFGLNLAGYDFLQGEMPNDDVMMLIKYYGFSIHLIITILYCKFIENRDVESMGIVKANIVKSYFLGTGIAMMLLSIIFTLCLISGSIFYNGENNDISVILILLYLGGFGIQGAMEEVMCRGFLMNSLRCKVSIQIAILISSFMFTFPHLSTLFQFSILVRIIGIVNLLLFSIMVSLLMIKYNNIWVSCAVHSVWNFVLTIIIGINVSGSNKTSSVFNFNVNKSIELLSGGQYGFEAGLICTVVLSLFIIMLLRKGKGERYGI